MEILGLTPWEWALPIFIGVVAGLLTNAIAIWMLFHPYESIYLGPIRVLPKGAVPKEIDRIARRIGETVGNELLTPADIARTLSSPAFRETFDQVLRNTLGNLLDREIGPLREVAGGRGAEELERVRTRLVERLVLAIEGYVASPEWEQRVRGLARVLTRDLRDRPLSEVLTPELHHDLMSGAAGLWGSIRESDEFQRVVSDALERALGNILVSEKPLRHYIPTGAVNLGEAFVEQYMPILLERLGEVLEDPDTRMRLQEMLRRFTNRFLEEQRTWKRIVGRLVITERTLAQTVEAIEQGGVDEISALMREPEVQARVATAVNQGIEDLLDRPVRDLLGSITAERAERLRNLLVERVMYLFRHPTTQDLVLRRLDSALSTAEAKTVGDVVQLLGDERSREMSERVAEWLVGVTRGPRVTHFLRSLLDRQTTWLLSVPVGRPRQYLPADALARVESLLFDPLWRFLQERVPAAVSKLPIAQMVENKLKGYPIQKVEELIWRVSRKELVLIVYLGGFLGALVGSLMLLTTSWPAGLAATGFFLALSFVFINAKG